MNAQTAPLIFEVDLGSNGGKFTFPSLKEADAWLQKEIQSMQWAREVRINDDPLRHAMGTLFQPLVDMNTFIQQAINAEQRKNETDLRNQLAAFKSRVEEYFRQKPRHSSLPRSKFVLGLKERRGVTAAVYALAYLEDQTMVPHHAQALEGVIEAFLFSRGLLEDGARERSAAQVAALDELLKSWKGTHDESQANTQALRSALESTIADGATKIESQAALHANLIAAHNQALTEAVGAGEKKLSDIAAAYDAHMALQAPVTYWESQRDHHRRLSIGFAIATSIWVLAGLGALYALADFLMTSAETIDVAGYPFPKVPFWHVAFAAVALTMYFWVTRILVRVLISQIHLNTDASERVVMAKTYIALLKDGKGPKDEDRQLVLQTLFRPSATGIVKDDAIPPTVLEWMTRIHGR